MMYHHPKERKTSLFFIEFLIVLFFFLLISTICLRMFAYSHQITVRTEALSHAQAEASHAAELLLASGGTASALTNQGFVSDSAGTTLFQTYDSSFQICSSEKACYTMTVLLNPDSDDTADIHITDQNGTDLFTLSVFFHRPLTRKEVLS